MQLGAHYLGSSITWPKLSTHASASHTSSRPRARIGPGQSKRSKGARRCSTALGLEAWVQQVASNGVTARGPGSVLVRCSSSASIGECHAGAGHGKCERRGPPMLGDCQGTRRPDKKGFSARSLFQTRPILPPSCPGHQPAHQPALVSRGSFFQPGHDAPPHLEEVRRVRRAHAVTEGRLLLAGTGRSVVSGPGKARALPPHATSPCPGSPVQPRDAQGRSRGRQHGCRIQMQAAAGSTSRVYLQLQAASGLGAAGGRSSSAFRQARPLLRVTAPRAP